MNHLSQLPSFIYVKFFVQEDGCDCDTQETHPLEICELNCKSFIVYFNSKCVCTLRINCYLETRFRSLGVCEYNVLWEKSCFSIFKRKIDQKPWRDSNSCWSNKVEGILLKILVFEIQVVAAIKRLSLLLFKSTVLVLTLFEVY